MANDDDWDDEFKTSAAPAAFKVDDDWEDSANTKLSNGDNNRSEHGGFRGRGRGGSFGDRSERPAVPIVNDEWEESGNTKLSSYGSGGDDRSAHGGFRSRGRGGSFGDRSERPPRDGRPGDWECSSCETSNFAPRNECYKCQAPKPEGVGNDRRNSDRPPREGRQGDWECTSCETSNFASRNECYKCQFVKPEGLGVANSQGGGDKSEKAREIYVPPEPTTDENEMFSTAIHAGINFDKFDEIEVNVSGDGAQSIKPIKTFAEAELREFLIQNVEKSGYTKPTPIQKHAIPIIMAKRDLMGCAQTGSGKTAAFVLPILDAIMKNNESASTGRPQCLIVAPTRELVIQIFEETRKFANTSWVKVCLAYGGTGSRHQSDNIAKGCNVLVATPGRLMDFVNKVMVTFEDLKFLVLDEADRMLDMGFRTTIDQIFHHETINRAKVQTLMFSATFPNEIQRLASQLLRNYMFLTVGIVGGASNDVEQEIFEVGKFKKRVKLFEILDQYCGDTAEERILVFVETKRTADYLASLLSETKISSTSLHGDRLQREREEALRDFRKGIRKVLVATSVAARGLDIKGVTHVINYDLPKEIQDYVHRIGRTGRVGNRGKATSFYDPENDSAIAGDMVRILLQAKQPVPEFLGDSGASANGIDQFGGIDFRKGVDVGMPQEDEEVWN